MTDDQWTDADDAQVALHTLPEFHPVALTVSVWNALDDLDQNRAVLAHWVTPESLAQWGDFTAVAAALREENLSVVGTARQHEGSPDVAYVWLIREGDDAEPRMARTPESVIIAMIFTWVWRPDLGGWRLHAVGGEAPTLNTLPRTSPGDAPRIESKPA